MAALEKGTRSPEFSLPLLNSRDGLKVDRESRVALVFFKVECPVCQFALPYFDRLYQRSKRQSGNAVFGISQNGARETEDFVRKYGVTFPVALDAAPKYVVSNAFGLTNVPTSFFLANGRIEFSSVSWVKDDVDHLYTLVVNGEGKAIQPLFASDEKIAAFKAG